MLAGQDDHKTRKKAVRAIIGQECEPACLDDHGTKVLASRDYHKPRVCTIG